MNLPKAHRGSLLLLLALLALAGTASAQEGQQPVANPEGLHLSRTELQQLLVDYEQTAASSEYSREMRKHARRTAQRVRDRLEYGDFQPGDRISLEVRLEPDMTGEFAVEDGRVVTVPNVGSISLAGVLRSELEQHMEQELGHYLRNPVVRARPLIRVAILGEVGSPGFYTLPASTILEDAVMTAGGPRGSADLDRIRVERSGERIWEDDALQQAMLEGRTLDQLSLQAGDRIVVPEKKSSILSWRGALTALSTIGSLVWLYTRITR